LTAGSRVVSQQPGHQRPRIALSEMRRMGANSTDLPVTGHAQPLAGHGDELSVQPNPIVCSHFIGTRLVESRERQRDQLEHLAGIFRGHQDGIDSISDGAQAEPFRSQHLERVQRRTPARPFICAGGLLKM
jgi:hypothetical protein